MSESDRGVGLRSEPSSISDDEMYRKIIAEIQRQETLPHLYNTDPGGSKFLILTGTLAYNTSEARVVAHASGSRAMHEDRAFTLIELLIVVAIIGILAAIAVPNFLNAQTRSKLARAYGDIDAIELALHAYRIDNNKFPPSHTGSNWIDPHILRFVYLTTPIAYLASIPMDVFAAKHTPDTGGYNTIGGKYVGDPYRYLESQFHPTIHQFSTTDEYKRYVYLLSSRGPDTLMNWQMDPRLPDALEYDSSNGLNSLGDINIFGP